ncbi:MAG: single-stranded DNA-binding protein [Pirellulales bacterium]|jgi:single-strand DNA-binding protein|nr:single-stranded DNA-binding protein [Pirellulales bacterium]
MASFNRVILLGNVTRDPELRYISSGTAVTDVGLAVNDRRKNASGEWVEETTFVDVTLWGRTAEVAGEYVTKGSPLLIEGRLKLDTWEKDGKKNSKLRVVCDRMQLLGGRGDGGGGRGRSSRPANEQQANDQHNSGGESYESAGSSSGGSDSFGGDDDIPF